jgi:PAS domain S-box-containing protein
MTIALLTLQGYAYGLLAYYSTPDFAPMTVPCAIGFIVLGTGTFLARTDNELIGVIMSDTAGGLLARRMIPMAVLLPILLGALRIAGENAGWYDNALGFALFATAFIVLFLIAIWWTARLLFRIDNQRRLAESGRAENEERFRELARNLGDVFWIKSLPDRCVLYVSPAYEKIWGRPVQTLYQNRKAAVDAMHPDDRERVKKVFSGPALLDTWDVDYRIVRPDGSIRWINDRAFPVHNDAGEVYRLAGVASDITERKEAREQLERFFTISIDLLATVHVDGYFTRVNPAWETTLGWTAEEMQGKPFIEFVHPDDREATLAEAARIASGENTLSFENRYRCKDGSYRWLLWSAAADVEKRILHGTARDITRRKQTEKALRESDARLVASAARTRLIVSTARDAFIGMDSAGLITDWNPQAELTFGWSHDEAFGQSMHNLIIPPKFREMHVRGLKHFLATGEWPVLNKRIELSALHRDGHEMPIEITISPIPFGNSFIFSAFLRDVTERKRAEENIMEAKEEAERANLAKSEFLSRMSHELRTPLNAILGFGQLLEMEDLPEHQRESASYILSAGRHLLDLINEVLDISNIESGGMTLSVEPVSLSEILHDAMNLMKPLAAERQIRLQSFVGEAAPIFVIADRQRLKQVFLNLLSNAIKYNRQDGEVRIELQGGDAVCPGGKLRIDIADTGIGFQPESLKRAFTPFERLGAEKTNVEGTGLGLALSKRLIELMGGRIEVRSEPGLGSTFTLELQSANDPVASLGREREVPEAEVASAAREVSVLYIEDNLSNLRVVERVMSRRPHMKLTAAMQGRVGLDLAYAHPPDLVLLDLHLPDIDGNEVLQRLRGDSRTSGIPVIVISADATQTQVSRLKAAGAHEYLTKPFDIQQLLATMDKTLEASARKRDAKENLGALL